MRKNARILDEFVAVSGFHRKHAMRLLRNGSPAARSGPRPGRRIYDDAVREALIVLWEASDRICGKRLKMLVPILMKAMERHGHLHLTAEIRTRLLAMSAATIDRALREVRDITGGPRRRRSTASTALRRSVPIRTFSDWQDPPPGFVEADLVAHSGPTALTSRADGRNARPCWCVSEKLLSEVLTELRPFQLLGFDTDNDSVFLNETIRDYCLAADIEFTRCRPYRKNDQAFVEQKNGAVVRRIVGYHRLEGLEAAAALHSSIRRFGCL